MTRAAEYHACAAEGLTQRETAERLGVTVSAVSVWAKRNGVRFAPAPNPGNRKHADADWLRCYEAGMTCREAEAALGAARNTGYAAARRLGIAWPSMPRGGGNDPDPKYDRLQEMAEAGMTAKEMAREIGVSPSAARAALFKRGIRLRDYQRRANGELNYADQYRACAAEGLTKRETAERLGVTVQAVRSWARRAGVTFSAGRAGKPRDDKYSGLHEMAASGMTAREMADALGLPKHSVRRALETRGIRLRDYRRREAAE